MNIPVVDIAPFLSSNRSSDRQSVIRQWALAFESVGFAVITGHGISVGLQEDLYHSALAFFDLPLPEKQKVSFPGPQKSQGFVRQGIESVAKTFGNATAPADLVENIAFSHVDWEGKLLTNELDQISYRQNLWPNEPKTLAPLIREYCARVQVLCRHLMRLSAAALDVEEAFFDPYYDRMTTHLRLAHYPDQPVAPQPGQLRYGAHTDFTGLTILRPDNAPGGLQVRMTDGSWRDVESVPDGLIVNAGDLLSRWTNDRWKSNVHRVVNPPRDLTGSTRRLSIVYFTGPNNDAICECLPSCVSDSKPARYAPIKCHDHLMEKISRSMPVELEKA